MIKQVSVHLEPFDSNNTHDDQYRHHSLLVLMMNQEHVALVICAEILRTEIQS